MMPESAAAGKPGGLSRDAGGVITVYLSIVTLLLISVTMVSLESARVAVVRTSTERYSGMAAEMLFSGYVKPLAERYGIFVLDTGADNDAASWFEDFLKMNLEENESSRKRPFAIYGKVQEADVSRTIKLSDSGWDMLLNEVKRCELYDLGEEGISKALGILKKTDTSGADPVTDDITRELKERGSAAEEAEAAAEADKAAEEADKEAGGAAETEAGPTGEGPEQKQENDDPRPGISRWIKSGILNLVMGDSPVSSRTIDTGDCSYKTGAGSRSTILDDFEDYRNVAGSLENSRTKDLPGEDISGLSASELLSDDADRKSRMMLLNLYIFSRFGTLRGKGLHNRKRTVLSYETEFILFGHKSDRENLESTMTSIYALRTGLNLAYLYADGGKTAEAAKAVSGMAAAAIPALGSLIQLLILTCWAGAEAVVDCSALAEGKKVPLWKSDSTWNLTFSQIAAIASRGGRARDYVKNGNKGLTYKQYVMILLLTVPGEKKIIRMLQLMEKNIRLEPGFGDFRFKNCIAGADFTVKAGIAPKFFRHPSEITYTCSAQYVY